MCNCFFDFLNSHNSVERSKALESLDSTQEVVGGASGEVDLNKDATFEEEEEEEETSCGHVDSPPGPGDIVTQVLLDPSGGAPRGEDNASSSEDVRKILDAQEENDTPGCGRLMADAAELLVFRSPNDSEAFGCLVDKISSSERRFCAGVKLTKQNDITKDVPANDNDPLALVPNQVSSVTYFKVNFFFFGTRQCGNSYFLCCVCLWVVCLKFASW